MHKNNVIFIALFCLIFSLTSLRLNAYDDVFEILVEDRLLIEDHFSLEYGGNIRVIDVYELYDINNQPNYLLVHFNTGGYAILSSETLTPSEYVIENAMIPYSDKQRNSKKVYLGPYNYRVVESEMRLKVILLTFLI